MRMLLKRNLFDFETKGLNLLEWNRPPLTLSQFVVENLFGGKNKTFELKIVVNKVTFDFRLTHFNLQ